MKKRAFLIARLKAKQTIRKIREQRQVKNASIQPIQPGTPQPTAPNLGHGLGGNNGLDVQP
jgi:hypothetical protein